jgi:hypothetical protein
MAVGSSALDDKREPESRRRSVSGKHSAAEGPTAVTALSDKSEPGPRQLPATRHK